MTYTKDGQSLLVESRKLGYKNALDLARGIKDKGNGIPYLNDIKEKSLGTYLSCILRGERSPSIGLTETIKIIFKDHDEFLDRWEKLKRRKQYEDT